MRGTARIGIVETLCDGKTGAPYPIKAYQARPRTGGYSHSFPRALFRLEV